MSRTVALVAPHFPPSNLTAVHRCRFFASHLPQFGWKVRVLTVRPEFYEEPLDRELERLVPAEPEIVRTPALPARPLRLLGDVGLRAFWWHYRVLRDWMKRGEIQALLISIPPNYSATLGPLLHRRYGIPYVIDYQDPWVHPWPGTEKRFSKAWFALSLSRRLEPFVLRNAALLTSIAPGYLDGVLRRRPELAERCAFMPVGGEEADHRYLDEHPRLPTLFDPADGNLHVVYAGAMPPRAHGTLAALFTAVKRLAEREPVLTRRVRLHFVGTGTGVGASVAPVVAPYAAEEGVADLVREHPGRIPYLDTLNHLQHAHAVLILGLSEPHYSASKLFQAVLSRRPVLAVLHAASTASSILKEVNAGPLVTFDDAEPIATRVEDIARALGELAREDCRPGREVDWKAFEAYSAERMTERLARALDTLCPNGDSGWTRMR